MAPVLSNGLFKTLWIQKTENRKETDWQNFEGVQGPTTQLLFKMMTCKSLSYNLNLSSNLTDDIWVSQQVTLHLECTNFIATAFDDVNTAAAHDPIHTLFVDRRIT